MQSPPIFLTLLSLLSFASAQSQPLIPWLGANGKYGYATEEGRVVVQPVFEEPGSIFRKNDVAVRNMQDGRIIHLLRNGMEIKNAKLVTHAEWITPGKT